MDKFNHGSPLSVSPPFIKMSVSPLLLEGRMTPEATTQRFVAFTVRVAVVNRDLHKEVMQVTQEEEVLLQLFKKPAQGKSLLRRLVLSSVHVSKQSQCGIET